MPKYKNISGDIIRFDYNRKEKNLLAGRTYELETNSYIDGLRAQGYLELTEEAAEAEETVADIAPDSEPAKPKK